MIKAVGQACSPIRCCCAQVAMKVILDVLARRALSASDDVYVGEPVGTNHEVPGPGSPGRRLLQGSPSLLTSFQVGQ